MIVTCPNCETRYQVDDAALGAAAGRRVRCASCGNLWIYSIEAEAIHAAVPGVTTEAAMAMTTPPVPPGAEPGRTEPRIGPRPLSTGPTAQPRPSVAAELPAAARQRGLRAGWLGLIVLVVVLVLVAYLLRDKIIAMWPATAPVYKALNLIEQPGAGLKATVTPRRTAQSLVIEGNIVNGSDTPRRVPKLRVTLRDGNRTDLESKVIDPPVNQLAPGASARFETIFEHPSITATDVAVEFAPD